MASLTWFFDGTYTRKQLRQLIGALIGNKTAARPLGATSGITSPVTLSATTTTWSVGAFTGVLDVETDATMGPEPFIFDATTTGSITAASASFDRYDLLSLTSVDATATLPTIVYTAGTVATTLPATPANSIAFCQITVPKSGTGSPTIQLIASRAYAAGGVGTAKTSANYPTTPYLGQYVDDASLGGLVRYNGTAWAPAGGTDTGWQAHPINSQWTDTVAGKPSTAWRKVGNQITWRGLIELTAGGFLATNSVGTFISVGNLATGARPPFDMFVKVAGSNPDAGINLIITANGSMTITTGNTATTFVDLSGIAPYYTN